MEEAVSRLAGVHDKNREALTVGNPHQPVVGVVTDDFEAVGLASEAV